MENNYLNRIPFTKKFNKISFFYFFSIILNLRLIFIFNNFNSGNPYPSQFLTLILIFGFIFFSPLVFKFLKNKDVFIMFILMNILGIYYGLGRAIDGNTYGLVIYIKNMVIPFITGIIISYLSLKLRIRNYFLILFSSNVIIFFNLLFYLFLGGKYITSGGILVGDKLSDGLFQTIGFYSLLLIMPFWLALKINPFKLSHGILNTYKNKLTLVMFFLFLLNFICG